MLENSNGLNENIEKKREDIKNQFLMGIERRERVEKSPFRRLKKNIIKVAAGIAIVCGITAAGCYVSPAFADMVKDIPVLSVFYNLVEGDNNERIAADNDYGEEMGCMYENDRYRFTFTHGMRDNINLVLSYTLEDKSDPNHKSNVSFRNLKFRTEDGEEWLGEKRVGSDVSRYGEGLIKIRNQDVFHHYDPDKNKRFTGEFNVNNIEGNIQMDFDVMLWSSEEWVYHKVMEVRDFSVPVGSLDKSRGVTLNLDQSIQIGKQEYILQNLSIEPTEMKAEIRWDNKSGKGYGENFGGIELKFEDNNGNEFGNRIGSGMAGRRHLGTGRSGTSLEDMKLEYCYYELCMDSPYFFNPEYIVLKEFAVLDEYEEELVIDVKQGKIISKDTERVSIKDLRIEENQLKFELVTEDRIGISDGFYKTKNSDMFQDGGACGVINSDTIIFDTYGKNNKLKNKPEEIEVIKIIYNRTVAEEHNKFKGKIRIEIPKKNQRVN